MRVCRHAAVLPDQRETEHVVGGKRVAATCNTRARRVGIMCRCLLRWVWQESVSSYQSALCVYSCHGDARRALFGHMFRRLVA